MERTVQIMDQATVNRTLARITHEIIERNNGGKDIVILGIKSRGIAIAKILAENIKKFDGSSVYLGTLDVTMKRDDYTKEEKELKATGSDIPCDLTDKTVIIVDDVLYTGRTIRAGIEEIFATYRPKNVQLAVLVDRGHREIPIRPDYVGKNIPTAKTERVKVVIEDNNEKGVYIIA